MKFVIPLQYCQQFEDDMIDAPTGLLCDMVFPMKMITVKISCPSDTAAGATTSEKLASISGSLTGQQACLSWSDN